MHDLLLLAVQRFADEVRPLSDIARDKLYTRAYRMTGSIGTYISSFRSIMARIPDMSEHDRIRWFQEGLTAQLQTECLVDREGEEFVSIEMLYKHAVTEARRLAVKSAHASRTGNPASAPSCNRSFNRFRPRVAAVDVVPRSQARKRSLAAADPAPVVASAKRPATGNRAGPSNGGKGGQGKPRNGNSTAANLLRKASLSGIHDLNGNRLPFHTVELYKKAGVCFNCFDLNNPHTARQCTAPKKQHRDGRVDDNGNLVYSN
jgi:hypothetical protein